LNNVVFIYLPLSFFSGGWSFGTQKFKDMSATRYTRQTFIYSAIPFLRDRNFDGLDLDWEYPKGSDDKKNFVLLLKGNKIVVGRPKKSWLEGVQDVLNRHRIKTSINKRAVQVKVMKLRDAQIECQDRARWRKVCSELQ